MGMSTSAYAVTPPDEEYEKMKKVYYSCEEAGIDIPDDVQEFFHSDEPDPKGTIVWLEDAKEINTENGQGLEIEIAKLPKNAKYIRVLNSW